MPHDPHAQALLGQYDGVSGRGLILAQVTVAKYSFQAQKENLCFKKVRKTACSTVFANFFFGLIFQNSILQQVHSVSGSMAGPRPTPSRILLPKIQAFFESMEGQREFAEWKAQQEQDKVKQD